MESFDLVVIGAGSAGVRLSRQAAQLGARVAVIENRYLGGTCVNVGCVPKKLLVYASQFSELARDAAGYGWHYAPGEFDWPTLRDNKFREIQRLNRIYGDLLDKANVTVIRGSAHLENAHCVSVDGRKLEAKRIALATGGWPRRGEYPGAELAVDSNQVFDMPAFPESVLIEGGGYVAVEFAGIFNGLGARTQLAYRGPLFLRGFDPDLAEFLAQQMRAEGVELHFQRSIQKLEKQTDGRIEVTFDDHSTKIVDMVFSAIGRRPMVDHLGLENTRVKLNYDGSVAVNHHFQTDEPSIFALGDLVGRLPLTPVALREAAELAHFLFADRDFAIDYRRVPTAVFCQPELATVGFSERDARLQFDDIDVHTSQFRPLRNTLSGNEQRTLMKLVVEKSSQKVLGIHMVGDHAAEIIQGFAVALTAGATKQDLDATLGVHPTSAEEFVTMK